MSTEPILKQNLEEKSETNRLFQMHLLFEQEVERPTASEVQTVLAAQCGEVDIVSGDNQLSAFALYKYKAEYEEGSFPAQVLLADVSPFDQGTIGDLERSQFWGVPDHEELLAGCHYSVMISDFMSAMLDYKQRCELIADWLETAISLFPACRAIWIPSSGRLMMVDEIINNPFEGAARFMQFGVNIRFFNIQDTDDMLMDSLGLHAIGLPDVQLHYHSLDPNVLSNYVFNVAMYVFDANAPIQSGQTIAGLLDGEMSPEVYWSCQYEMSLIQPSRDVMDICPGEFAAGGREESN